MVKTRGPAAYRRFLAAERAVSKARDNAEASLRLDELRAAAKALSALFARNGVPLGADSPLLRFAVHAKPRLLAAQPSAWRAGYKALWGPAWRAAKERVTALSVGLEERAVARLLQWEYEFQNGRRDAFTLAELAADLGTTPNELQGAHAARRRLWAEVLSRGTTGHGSTEPPADTYRHPRFVEAWRRVQAERRAKGIVVTRAGALGDRRSQE